MLLTRQGLAIAARCDHPAVIDGEISFDAYMHQRHVLISPGSAPWSLVDAAFREARLKREIQVRCLDYWTACRIVALTDCLLTATRATITRVAASFPELQVCSPPTELQMEPQDVYLYWHAARDNDPPNRWLRESLLAIFEERQGKAPSKSSIYS